MIEKPYGGTKYFQQNTLDVDLSFPKLDSPQTTSQMLAGAKDGLKKILRNDNDQRWSVLDDWPVSFVEVEIGSTGLQLCYEQEHLYMELV